MTSIGTVAFAPQIALGDEPDGLDPSPGAQTQLAGSALAARDALIPDLADTSAGLNQLQSLASGLSPSAMPAPALPVTRQQSPSQPAPPALKQDFYADGDDAG